MTPNTGRDVNPPVALAQPVALGGVWKFVVTRCLKPRRYAAFETPSRSDASTVAVGFNPRTACHRPLFRRVATTEGKAAP
jgi:hypothetical protein